MKPARLARWLTIIALAAAPLLAGAQAEEMGESPPALAWDQAQVTALAQELVSELKGIRQALRQQGDPGLARMQSKAYHRLSDDLRLLESESKQLARALEAGEGHDETFPIYRRMQTTIRDAREEARRQAIALPTQEKIDAGRTVLEKLAQYY